MKVVVRLLPFQSTVDPLTKFDPFNVRTNGLPPATAPEGDSEVSTGTAVPPLDTIVSVTTVEVLPALLASPPYTAVIECVPSVVRLEVVKVATLAVFSVAVPIVVAPSWKVTVPVGGVAPVGATMAVNVTNELTIAGFAPDVRLVLVGDSEPPVAGVSTKP